MLDRFSRWLRGNLARDTHPQQARPWNRGEITLSGPSGHGKTTFAYTLMVGLKQLGALWPHWHCSLSPEVEEQLRRQAEAIGAGRVPQVVGNSSAGYAAQLSGLPRWGDRSLLLTESQPQRSRLDRHANQIILPVEVILISFEEVREDVLERLDTTVAKCLWPSGPVGGSRLRSSKVLVLSQADRCLWPAEIQNHLLDDPFRGLWTYPQDATTPSPASPAVPGRNSFPTDKYLEQMAAQDTRLKAWLAATRDGATALEHFAAAGADLRVCAVSALGSRPIDNKLSCPWRPCCVLDPLLWAFEMTST